MSCLLRLLFWPACQVEVDCTIRVTEEAVGSEIVTAPDPGTIHALAYIKKLWSAGLLDK